uniref:hypothetical protein n=1 Tax=Alicyclobacillus sendaiensis TaxID=192387 RepID=UPI0012EECE87
MAIDNHKYYNSFKSLKAVDPNKAEDVIRVIQRLVDIIDSTIEKDVGEKIHIHTRKREWDSVNSMQRLGKELDEIASYFSGLVRSLREDQMDRQKVEVHGYKQGAHAVEDSHVSKVTTKEYYTLNNELTYRRRDHSVRV